MLGISIDEKKDAVVLRRESRLIGSWVEEAKQRW
jgi:hypothetical protein